MKYLLLVFLAACSAVGPGERGVRVHMGSVSNDPLEPGPHFWLPFIMGVAKVNVQIQKSDDETSAASKDMQEIKTKLAINWNIDPRRVVEMYKSVGDETQIFERVIAPAVSEVMKSAMAKLTAEEVLSRRLELKKDIDTLLVERLRKYGVNLLDVSIVNLTFSHDFTQAIERKQIAEQEAKQAEYRALEAVQEAKANVNRAEGQAQAQKLLQSTITSGILQQEAIKKWDGKFPTYMSGTLPFIQFKGEK